MKRYVILGLIFLVSLYVHGQSPLFFKYQSVVRDLSGNVITGKTVSFRISILKNNATGPVVYSEIHQKPTNAFGLVDLEIGDGTPGTGEFGKIDWGLDKYFIKIEIDPNGGSAFQNLGISQLLSVPYALYARNVQFNNDADADSTNEIQKLTFSNGILSLSRNGGSVTIPTNLPGDDWGKQTVVTDSTLTGNGTLASPLKMAQRGAASGQVLKWNGTTWKPAADETGSGGAGASGPAGGDLTGTYPNPAVGNDKITSAKILDKDVQTVDLADGSVTNVKIADNAVTNSRISVNAVTGTRIADGAVSTSKIADGAVSTAKLDTLSVTTGKIGKQAVTTDKIAAGAVTGDKIAPSGATPGQALKWNGTTWAPGDDMTAVPFSLPYAGSVNAPVSGFSVTNTNATDFSSAIHGFSSSATKLTYGVRGTSASPNGTGVFGEATATDGQNTGVYGVTSSYVGRGVAGYAQSATGGSIGVLGVTSSSEGQAVWGKAEATTGSAYGVVGSSQSPSGYGVFGAANSSSGMNYGIYGSTKSGAGTAVFGSAENVTGTTYGIKGTVVSPNGFSGHFSGGKFYVGGNMGIGTENPGARLEVAGQVKITGGNPAAGKVLTSDGNGLATWALPSTGSLLLPSRGTVNTDTTALNIINTSVNALYTPVAISGISAGTTGTGIYGISSAATGVGRGIMGEAVSSQGYSGYFKGGQFYVDGNVGIGTKAPTYKLDVVGNRIRLSSPSGSYVSLRTDDATGFVNLYYSCANMMIQGSAPGENLLIHPQGTSKVGIRTWTPVYDLDVTGNIRATGSYYYGGNSGGQADGFFTKPDNVFKNAYRILPTEEVERFIRKEGHLPWVTSALQEKAENGVATNITRMTFETLESVENLQMQVIEQQKLIKTLQDQNEQLSRENKLLKQEDDQINTRLTKLEKLTGNGKLP